MVRSQSNNRRTQTQILLKYKNKNNKKVIKAERVAGKFTTIPHRIIHDKRLSTNARILLISILSDADSFDISRTGLINRIGISEYKLDNAIKELIKYRYLKKTKRYGQYFHYTICEYGNLKIEEKDSEEVNESQVENSQDENETTSYMDSEQFQQDWKQLTSYLSERKSYVNVKLLEDAIQKIETRNDVFEMKQTQDSEIKKNKIKYFKIVEEFVNGGCAPKDLKPKILKEVRRLITDEHKKPSTEEVNKIRNRISRKKQKNKVEKYGFDYETQLVDRYENPLD